MLTSIVRPYRSHLFHGVRLRNQHSIYGRYNQSALFADAFTSARKHLQGFCFTFITSAFHTIILKQLLTAFSSLLLL